MMRKFIAMFATVAFAMATFTATPASAQRYRDRGDYHNGRGYDDYDRGRRGGYDRGYYNRPECYDRQGRNHCYDRHDDDDNDDAVAAGVIGLVLGAVIASAVANSNNTRQNDGYYSNNDGYRDDGYRDDRDYRDRDGYYRQQCTQQVRRWDRRAGRYVIVDVPC